MCTQHIITLPNTYVSTVTPLGMPHNVTDLRGMLWSTHVSTYATKALPSIEGPHNAQNTPLAQCHPWQSLHGKPVKATPFMAMPFLASLPWDDFHGPTLPLTITFPCRTCQPCCTLRMPRSAHTLTHAPQLCSTTFHRRSSTTTLPRSTTVKHLGKQLAPSSH
mgnify:CR=1 FL=1